jgi:serine/threonine protein kinase
LCADLDTKPHEFAIENLPDAFAADSERLARFASEALLLASLKHQNIAATYGIEEEATIMDL